MIVSHNATSSLAMTIITYIYIGTSFTEESPNVEIQNVGKVVENVVFIWLHLTAPPPQGLDAQVA
jgi:hypothetical protein